MTVLFLCVSINHSATRHNISISDLHTRHQCHQPRIVAIKHRRLQIQISTIYSIYNIYISIIVSTKGSLAHSPYHCLSIYRYPQLRFCVNKSVNLLQSRAGVRQLDSSFYCSELFGVMLPSHGNVLLYHIINNHIQSVDDQSTAAHYTQYTHAHSNERW